MKFFQKKSTNYGKIIAITLAAVAGVCAVAFVVYKLIKKYTDEFVCDCDDLLDECECECEECELDECDICVLDDECEECAAAEADAE